MAQFPPEPSETTYLVDQENPAELGRLINQEKFMIGVTGLYPTTLREEEVAQMRRVLDIGCGPGNWCFQMAAKHPHLQIVGLDVSSQMIQYARAGAESRELSNVTFLEGNALQPLPFDDDSVDIVSVRYAGTWIPKELYPQFLQECQRVLKPGGTLNWTESENGTTSSASPATAKCLRWITRALALKGLFFSIEAQMTITPDLLRLLKVAGFTLLPLSTYCGDSSKGMVAHTSLIQGLVVLLQLIQSLLSELGISQEEFDQTIEAMKIEVEDEHFTMLSYMFCIHAKAL